MRVLLAVALALSLVGGGVTPVSHHLGVETGKDRSWTPSVLTAEGHRLDYQGDRVGAVSVYANNTGGSLTGRVTVTFRALNGSVVANATQTDVVFAPGGNTVAVALATPVDPVAFARVEVTVERTL